LCCKDPNIKDIYVGHTTNFNKRKNQHRVNCNNEKLSNQCVYKYIREHGGFNNWDMFEVEQFSCNNKREAESREQYWIEYFGAKLNTINPYTLCKDDPKMYKKIWYENVKDYILHKEKQNYQKNKEKYIERVKNYSQNNKEKVKQNQKLYREKNRDYLIQQSKTYREQHLEQVKLCIKQWREKHLDEIKLKKSEKYTCMCGAIINIGSKYSHEKTKTHQNIINNISNPEPIKKYCPEKARKSREKRKEKIQEWKKKHYTENKEKILQKNKEYMLKHKEQIKEKQQEYVENNKSKINDYKQNWYQMNKEKIKQKNSNNFTCECGSIIKVCNKSEHFKSIKHCQFIEAKIN
jgi:hypothetical protein